VTNNFLELDEITFRNFNICPHCAHRGEDALLCRLSEGMPMISRSDGKTFHLLLSDGPIPYPIERKFGKTKRVSVCFWYSHGCDSQSTCSTVVVLPRTSVIQASLFRQIESLADLLSVELLQAGGLAKMYEFAGEKLCEVVC
jgi:hypothetical protein